MSVHTFKAALNAAAYPMLYRQASRSVLHPQEDVVSAVKVPFFGTLDSADYNVMQLLYCENVIPVAKGIQSVGFFEQIPAYSPAVTDFDRIILIKDSFNNNALFSPARGKNYVLSDVTGIWTSYAPFVFSSTKNLVTHGYVNGRTLIFYEGTKCVEWDPSVPNILTRVLTLPAGFAISDIRGNAAASNYHLLFTEVDILWSNPNDILDFDNPTLGSGRQIPNDLKGKITSILPISGGFLIYTTENVVAASFTNDAAAPFAFREVQNSAGVSSGEQSTGNANVNGHYSYGVGGFQLLTLQRAESVFPEAAEFLISNEMDEWDADTKEVVPIPLTTLLQPKMQYLGSRHLAISYGSREDIYEFILLYDTVLQRWGKLRIDHMDCAVIPLEVFSGDFRYYQLTNGYSSYSMGYDALEVPLVTTNTFRQNYGVLLPDGTIMLMVSAPGLVTAGGVVVFGRVQIVRDKMVTMQSAELDGVLTEPVPQITLLGSSTGNGRDSQVAMDLIQSADGFAEYKTRFTAKNMDVALEGNFSLTNMVLTATTHGKR